MADDSVKQDIPATPEEKPTGPVSMIVPKFGGGVREILKDPVTGKIVAKPKRMVSTLEVTRLGRKFLDMQVPNDKKLGTRAKKRIEQLFETMYEIATSVDKDSDPKDKMAAVQAFKEITLRIYGKPTISDEEKDALERAGVKIVVIPAPVLMNPAVVPEHQQVEKPVKPSFIEAEYITNEPEEKK